MSGTVLPAGRAAPAHGGAGSTALRSLKPSPLPELSQLMLCTLVSEPFDDPHWIFEPKFDGQRVLGRFDGKQVQLISRRGHDDVLWFPEIPGALAKSLDRPALLDGELVCLDERGHSSFRMLQQRFHLHDPREIAQRAEQYPTYFYVFDLLYTDRYNLTSLPLSERKELLRQTVAWSDRIRWTETRPREGTRLFQEACRLGQEGIIGKRLDSPYVPGRSPDWVKIKCIGRQEFVLGGFTEPQGARVGLGALLVGYWEQDRRTLVYAGKVGTGFNHETLMDLRSHLDALEQPHPPFNKGNPPRGSGVHWVKPELVAEIAFAEWTQNDMLRQPRFEGLRLDKQSRDVRREVPKDTEHELHPHSSTMNRSTASPAKAGSESSLAEYQRKRDFTKTAEPPAKAAKAHAQPLFVIQEHHARRLHYDFRLEADGVLKSWAVTKIPTMEPGIRRLAVRTEDHPLSYADFAGNIPEGQYGAGHVEIWDRGNYENLSGRPLPEALAAGKAEIDLHGTKLKGKFALVRMGGGDRRENWLLIKMKDQFARSALGAPASLPASRRPPEEPAGKDARAPSTRQRANASAQRSTAGTEMDIPRSRRLRSAAAPTQPSGTVTTLPFAITHPDKVMFPDKGYTKAEVLKYYAAVAPLLLPHLRDRPMTLERLPEGVRPDAPHFWQKHTPSYYPMWIPRTEITGADGKRVNYPLVNDAESLLYLVNQGALCFHPWLSRMANLDRPDFVLFDLDPGESSFANLIKIAKQLHQELETERVDNFVKTSGKTGLHVLVPWRQRGGYDEAREWALEMARRVAAEIPTLATTERSKLARRGRAYIDVMQNAKGHHVVPPYVLRAVPTATISTPLAWSELNARLTPERFDLKSALRRFEKQKEDLMGSLGAQ